LSKDLDQSDLQDPYRRLLFNSVERVFEKWVEDRYVDALREALKLVNILPTDIKEALWDKRNEIAKDLNQAYNVNGSDFFLTHLRRNRTASKVASIRIGPFVDEITRRLDEKRWLERGAFKARFNKKKRLE